MLQLFIGVPSVRARLGLYHSTNIYVSWTSVIMGYKLSATYLC